MNALFLHYPLSGTGRYLVSLIERLGDLTLVGAEAFPPAESVGREPDVLVATPFDRRQRNLAKVWFEQVGLPAAAARRRASLVHVPYFAAPLLPRVSTVVTVHDLVPVLRPEYRRTPAQRLYTALVVRGLASASRIITDSAASARDLQSRLRVSAERIRVIPLGVDGRFRPLETDQEREWAEAVLARYGLDRPYLLYLGGLDRRKNVDGLIRAFDRLKRERGVPHVLVIVGGFRLGDDLFYDPRGDVERLGLDDSVRLLGQVGDVEVRALHARAEAFVFPSIYEGFGLPPLEAMACGAPVVCSRASSLPEVVGDAGILFDPTDEAALADALWRVLSEPDLRRYLRQRALARAAEFTWEKTARATAAVWDEVARRQR